MSSATRQRLIEAALELFLTQGISSTTTRQIANLAGVNEVTLFRQFGNKHGLLLSVLEEADPFTNLESAFQAALSPADDLPQSLKIYADTQLRRLEERPDLVRSLIGEADQYPPEARQALGKRLSEATRYAAQYFEGVMQRSSLALALSPTQLASLIHTLLLGYAVIEFTSEKQDLWGDRGEFLTALQQLFLQTAPSESALAVFEPAEPPAVMDLPAPIVHGIIQAARKSDLQDYAIAYLLFGAGLTKTEIIHLQRSQHISDPQQQLMTITTPQRRQVPVNQWILGKRYGSYTSNPLTKWLKSRKDDHSAMFLDPEAAPLSAAGLQKRWQSWSADISLPQSPTLLQAHQTWCVEMLMRGMSLENLSILTRQAVDQLQPYEKRAKEKAALEAAIQLDRKPQ
ncbi:TetR family transcriptional regulator [filamentous cyanobacterium CCP5]|nr:TetR family transcriptional regulator [filamentous cyanobacterium CCP5]